MAADTLEAVWDAVDVVDEEVSAVPDDDSVFPVTAAHDAPAGAGPDVLLLPRHGQRAALQVQPHIIASSTASTLET